MATRPPPLLLTKRLTSFLHLNLSANISTLLLLTSGGKLLAYASNPPIPVATLRTHGTVAASLYAIHSSGTDRETVDTALGEREDRGRPSGRDGGGPIAVTIQLETGAVLVIRRLRCGMLFVCMGSPDNQSSSSSSSRPQTTYQQYQPFAPGGTSALTEVAAAAATANSNNNSTHHTLSSSPQLPSAPPTAATIGSPSEAASILSNMTTATAQTTASSVIFGAGTAGVMATRRHAEELARWLDDKLGTLETPSDGLGGVL